uniref:nose resistant to fluoxetine protein 6-like n=1 Tax=Styela clava TaxID=7725 RepID=UPI00193A16CD|nr:nose resistant to fluoxetine protein 6-like [Styela clava]
MNVALLASADTNSAMHSSIRNHPYPSYLPQKALDSLLRAREHNFYESSVESSLTLLNNIANPEIISRISEQKAEGDEPTCNGLVLKLVLATIAGVPYARQIDDAGGKEESGLLKGNYMWLGTYYQCSGATNGKDITTKMCTSIFGDKPNSTEGLQLGVCFPDICTVEEINVLMQALIDPNMTTTYMNSRCPKPIVFDAVDITAIVIFSLLGVFVLFGTIYEVYCILKRKTNENTHRERENFKQKSALSSLAMSFSVVKNTNTLLDLTQKEGNIHVLNGLRFLSMSWVILGHTFNFILGVSDNMVDFADWALNHGTFQVIINGVLSVDTFFFLSGLLVTYLGMREMTKRRGKLNVPLMYLSRYLRLTPTVALIILFMVTFVPMIVEGPLEPISVEPVVGLCQKYWWTNLLYINNLYPADLGRECIGWTWYLANDMQFYLLSPIFLYLLYKYPKVGLGVMGGVVLASSAIVGALSTHFNLYPDSLFYGYLFKLLLMSTTGYETRTDPPPEGMIYFDDIYTKPWCRIGVYMIGMATGYIIFVTKGKIKMNEWFVTLMWMAVAAIELTVIYGWTGTVMYSDIGEYPSQNLASFYNAVFRPIWAFGLSWLTIACVSGYGGPINSFLSWKFFIPLSRLTFCAYLIHPIVITYMYASREIEIHFALNIMIYYFLAAMLLSYGLAYLLHLVIEAPVAGIQKIIFPSKKRPEIKSMKLETEANDNAVAVENGFAKASLRSQKQGIDNGIVLKNTCEIDKL